MHKGAKLDDYVVFRRRAIELYQQGKKQKFIVKALGVSQPTVSRWISEFKTKGEAFLERPKIGGSKRKLTPDQLEELTNMLDEGAGTMDLKAICGPVPESKNLSPQGEARHR